MNSNVSNIISLYDLKIDADNAFQLLKTAGKFETIIFQKVSQAFDDLLKNKSLKYKIKSKFLFIDQIIDFMPFKSKNNDEFILVFISASGKRNISVARISGSRNLITKADNIPSGFFSEFSDELNKLFDLYEVIFDLRVKVSDHNLGTQTFLYDNSTVTFDSDVYSSTVRVVNNKSSHDDDFILKTSYTDFDSLNELYKEVYNISFKDNVKIRERI